LSRRLSFEIHGNSVNATTRSNVRAKISNGNLVCLAKVKLLASFPTSLQWIEVYIGYLALSSFGTESAFFTLVDCDDFSVLMVHELYFHFRNPAQK
jgi:hypothetical protein